MDSEAPLYDPDSEVDVVAGLFQFDPGEDAVVAIDGLVLRYWQPADAWSVYTEDGELVDLVVPDNWRSARALLRYLRHLRHRTGAEDDSEADGAGLGPWRWSQ